MDQEEKMNWEKLLKHLDGHQDDGQADEELNQEELDMLLLAEETNMSLKRTDPETKFPVEAGWEELEARYKEKNREANLTIGCSKRNWFMAAAAVLACVIGSVWWLSTRPVDPVKDVSIAVTGIKLTLENGKTVTLEEKEAPVLKSAGAALNGGTLVYKKETDLSKEEGRVSMNVLEVPYGKQTKVELGDGTAIWLNSGSKLIYPSHFSASKREVTLEGEAFFEVSHNPQRPFIVHVKDLNVQVLGTAFNINSFGPAVQTALVRGKVGLEAGNQSILLMPGELGSYTRAGETLSKTDADLKLYTAWKDGEIYFDNSSLAEIAFRLEREYNLRFSFADPALKNLHFMVDMPKTGDDIQQVLKNIRLSTNEVDFVIKGNVVEVKRRH
ncbi:FecR family protein [Pedobacter nutrimenti]|uniref:FecR family protein n=1 Tax=Pedobacter nutrimenti TaxID=1241337 RepID=UPI00292E7303|nr:FecR domain-containing protein [Pedobacter nutrimenti]